MRFPLRRALLLTLAPALSACVLDGSNPVRDAARAIVPAPKPVEAPDFVARSRRPDIDYVPVGTSAPPRPVRAKSAAGVKDLEAELDASRRRNEAKGRDAAGAGAAAKPAP
ncbi:conserved hypothetical protein [Methylobacterium sp. 4-46]|uniref:hypothetical protein n=1 Tax=unclassified Methylobacterium TaxID=2615210 RepID=UPI000152CD46|nr:MULTISPECIES: hypothetical protein [Methylobacterium]ACA20092.1 conserved hypothetical protein [Methylobacterium sp. 4-46]WFT79277.1 hypothetical protein QA634_29295 [Methylobacterium nodulans]